MGAKSLSTIDHGLETLSEQLKSFGLNPSEWNLLAQRRHSNLIEMEHRKDPAFRIHVQVRTLCSGLLRVDRLSVISI